MGSGGRVVWITGAARGIGLATARAFVSAGAKVVGGDVDPAVEDAMRGAGAALGLRQDVADPASWQDALARVEADVGPIYALVNNAGLMALGPADALRPDQDRLQVEVNLMGVIHGSRAVLPGMRARGDGVICNVASAAGRVPFGGGAVYCATKHAVIGYAEALRAELAPAGVHVGHVLPGLVETELAAGAGRMRFPRTVRPDEVAAAIVRVVERREISVCVPRFVGVGQLLLAALPWRVSDALGRMFGTHQIGTPDAEARRSYDARAFGDGSDSRRPRGGSS